MPKVSSWPWRHYRTVVNSGASRSRKCATDSQEFMDFLDLQDPRVAREFTGVTTIRKK